MRKFEREEVEKLKWKGKIIKLSRGPLFVNFETTEICLGSTKMGNFYREKAYFTSGKNRKNDFAPSEKYSSNATGNNKQMKG